MLALSEIFVLAGLGVVSLSRTAVDFKFGRVRYKILLGKKIRVTFQDLCSKKNYFFKHLAGEIWQFISQ